MAIIQAKSNLIQTSDKGKPLRGEEYNSQLLNTTVFIEAQDFNHLVDPDNDIGSILVLAPIMVNTALKGVIIRSQGVATVEEGEHINISFSLCIAKKVRADPSRLIDINPNLEGREEFQVVKKLPATLANNAFNISDLTGYYSIDYSTAPSFVSERIWGLTIRELLERKDNEPGMNPQEEELMRDIWYLCLRLDNKNNVDEDNYYTFTNPALAELYYTLPVVSSTGAIGSIVS